MPGGTAAPPDLEVRTRRSVHQLTAGTTYRIGRDPKSDLVMTDSRVSWRHGELRVDGDGWIVEDLGSTNGTFLGSQRLDRIEIREECVVRLGNPDDGAVLRFVPQAAAAPPPAAPPADHPGTALSMPAAPAPSAPQATPEPAPRHDSESWWQSVPEPGPVSPPVGIPARPAEPAPDAAGPDEPQPEAPA